MKISTTFILRLWAVRAKSENKLKADWDYNYFFKAFAIYLHENRWAIEDAYRYLSDSVNCIMCFENRAHQCHRLTVAQKIKEHDGNGLMIEHIQ